LVRVSAELEVLTEIEQELGVDMIKSIGHFWYFLENPPACFALDLGS
jgi:hypothetical protein